MSNSEMKYPTKCVEHILVHRNVGIMLAEVEPILFPKVLGSTSRHFNEEMLEAEHIGSTCLPFKHPKTFSSALRTGKRAPRIQLLTVTGKSQRDVWANIG